MTREEGWPSDLDTRAALDMSYWRRSIRRDVSKVIERVAAESQLRVDQITDSHFRHPRVTQARRTAARELSAMAISARGIAEALGLQNHSSVLYLLNGKPKKKLRDQFREVIADAERLSQQPEDGHKGTPLMVRQIGNGAQPGVFGDLTSEAQEIARR